MSGRILVVDSDLAVTRFLAAELPLDGYAVDVLACPEGQDGVDEAGDKRRPTRVASLKLGC